MWWKNDEKNSLYCPCQELNPAFPAHSLVIIMTEPTQLLDHAKGRVKVKLSLYFFLTKHHAMEAYWGNGGITPHILDLSTRWR
jgi:hypothetical protein